MIDPMTESAFWSKVTRLDGGCWTWNGTLDRYGYGSFRVRVGGRIRRQFIAHRFSYELVVGTIPEGLVLDHRCRNRMCVNPDHLERYSPESTRISLPWG